MYDTWKSRRKKRLRGKPFFPELWWKFTVPSSLSHATENVPHLLLTGNSMESNKIHSIEQRTFK